MNKYAEEFDSWNDATGVGIIDLSVRDLIVKRDTDNAERAFVGQLFTMTVGMMTGQGKDIKASVTGYLRGNASIQDGYTWMAEDCYAPRSHENGVPLVRLLERPEALRKDNGDRFTPLALGQRIAEQLSTSSDWRVELASMVGPVSSRAIHEALGLPFQAPNDATEEVATDDFNLDFNDDEELVPQAHTADEGVTRSESEKNDDILEQIDNIELEPGDNELVSSSAETETEAAIDLEDDAENVRNIIDEWDEEDASESLEGLPSLGQYDSIDLDADDELGDTISEPAQSQATSDRGAQIKEAINQSEKRFSESDVTPDMSAAPTAETQSPTIAPAIKAPTELMSDMSDDRKPTPTINDREQIMTEVVLHNEGGYDVGFFGFEVGSLKLVSTDGENGTLYRTKSGLSVVHIDGQEVKHFKDEDKDQLFAIMGFGREAKQLYAEAGVKCVKWLD